MGTCPFVYERPLLHTLSQQSSFVVAAMAAGEWEKKKIPEDVSLRFVPH